MLKTKAVFDLCVANEQMFITFCSSFQILCTYDWPPSSGLQPYKHTIHDPHLTGYLQFLLWTCAAVSCEAEDITQLWWKKINCTTVLVAVGAYWICLECQTNEVSWKRRAQPWKTMSSSSFCVPVKGLRSGPTGRADLWRRGRRQVSGKLVYWWLAFSLSQLL